MLTKATLEALATARLAEAIILLREGQFSEAYYLGGYAAELGLKAVIAKKFEAEAIPDIKHVQSIHTHDLGRLSDLAALTATRENREKEAPRFAENWHHVKKWSVDARYRYAEEEDARLLIECLSEPETGVFAWIRSQW
jgi:HEPN domain-containing protein